MENRNLEELAERRRIARVKTSVEDELLGKSGVTAVDVDYKSVGGKTTKTLCIVIWVEKKKNVSKKDRIPSIIKGIPTDILEGSFSFGDPLTKKSKVTETSKENALVVQPTDPLVGGVSIGPLNQNLAGTLGAVILHNGVQLILSNFHVLASGANPQPGDEVVQPGIPDGGNNNLVVGQNVRGAFGQPSNVDAAVSRVINRWANVGSILQIGQIIGMDVTFPGDYVCKYGRTTKYTAGVVISDTFTFQATHPIFGHATFYNQLRVRNHSPRHPFLEPGDSGSILVNETSEAVGLLLGQHTTGNKVDGIANPIQDVFRELGLNHFI